MALQLKLKPNQEPVIIHINGFQVIVQVIKSSKSVAELEITAPKEVKIIGPSILKKLKQVENEKAKPTV